MGNSKAEILRVKCNCNSGNSEKTEEDERMIVEVINRDWELQRPEQYAKIRTSKFNPDYMPAITTAYNDTYNEDEKQIKIIA